MGSDSNISFEKKKAAFSSIAVGLVFAFGFWIASGGEFGAVVFGLVVGSPVGLAIYVGEWRRENAVRAKGRRERSGVNKLWHLKIAELWGSWPLKCFLGGLVGGASFWVTSGSPAIGVLGLVGGVIAGYLAHAFRWRTRR